MEAAHILAVVQCDLQLLWRLQHVIEDSLHSSLNVTRSSQEAILYLRGVGIYGDRGKYRFPHLLVLDSENPDAEDLNLLSWVREQPHLRTLPVGLLCSGPAHPMHILFALDPCSFIVDRSQLDELGEVLNQPACVAASSLKASLEEKSLSGSARPRL
jgi:hypothetical protein